MKFLFTSICLCSFLVSSATAENAVWFDVTQGMNIEQVSAAIPNLQDRDRLLASLHLAYLYSHKSNPSPAEMAAAIQLYREVLSSGSQCNALLTARVQLASLMSLTGKPTEAITLLDTVIHVDPDTLVADELTPEMKAGLNELGLRERAEHFQMDSPMHIAVVASRMADFRKNTLESYLYTRHAALSSRVMEVYRLTGLEGVKEYANSFRSDEDAAKCLQKFISNHAPK